MTRRFLPLSLYLCLTCFGLSQSTSEKYEQARTKLQAELDASIAAYQESQTEISSEKRQLLKQTNILDQEILQRRSQLRDLATAHLEQQRRSQEIEQELEAMEGQSSYIDGVLREFSTNFLSRIHVSEQQAYLSKLTNINEAVRESNTSYDERVTLQLDTIRMSLERLRSILGGDQFEGNVLDDSGELREGTITLFGPSAYFSADDGAISGVLQANPGTIEPRVVGLSKENSHAIAAFSRTGKGKLPIDATSTALAISKEQGNALAHIRKGGWVGYIIIALGITSFFLLIIKLLSIRKEPLQAPQGIPEIAREALAGDIEKARTRIQAFPTNVKRLLGTGIENAREKSELLEEAMLSEVLEYRLRLERYVPLIALTAATAPLLGLLGTVVGMIKTFTLITVFGTGDAKSLSSGISEALVTTELGLIIAVPALIAHGIIQHMIKTRSTALERVAFDFAKTCASRTESR